jgi:hypothetical protein
MEPTPRFCQFCGAALHGAEGGGAAIKVAPRRRFAGTRTPVTMIGKRFGSLTVVQLAAIGPRRWKCLCNCGRYHVVEGGNLRRKVGGTRSCGQCWRAEGATNAATV